MEHLQIQFKASHSTQYHQFRYTTSYKLHQLIRQKMASCQNNIFIFSCINHMWRIKSIVIITMANT